MLKTSTIAMMKQALQPGTKMPYTVAEIVHNEYGLAISSGYFDLFQKIQRKFEQQEKAEEEMEKRGKLSEL